MTVFGVKYDAVYPLGQWCAPTMCLKKLGFRTMSGPFDWMGRVEPIRHYAEVLAEDGFMKMFADKGRMKKLGDVPGEGTEHWKDTVEGWEIRHEFKAGVPFDENYANFRKLLDRRGARLIGRLKAGGKILFVHWLAEGHYPREEAVDAAHLLRKAFPGTAIDLLVIETEKLSKEVTYEEPEPGVVFVVGDFYDQERYNAVVGNEKLALSVLRRIRMRGRWRNLMRMKVASITRRLKHGMSRVCPWKRRQSP